MDSVDEKVEVADHSTTADFGFATNEVQSDSSESKNTGESNSNSQKEVVPDTDESIEDPDIVASENEDNIKAADKNLVSMESNTLDISESLGKQSSPQATQDGSTTGNETNDNRFAYLTARGYTSEIFKVEIYNLPPHIVYSNLKKRLQNLGLKPCKIKIIPKGSFAFVNFRCEEDRQQALTVIPGHVWKSRQLKIKVADPAKDPLLVKRKQEAGEGASRGKVPKLEDEEPSIPVEERLNLAVTPLLHMPYEDQLHKKVDGIKEFLKKLGREMERTNPDLREWLKDQRATHDGMCCQMHPIKMSPVTKAYRNKCEFTIGRSEDGKDNVVGFRLGSYKGGSVSVANPSTCVHIPDAMKTVTKELQSYLQGQSSLEAFKPETNQGHWRQLTLRTTLNGAIMATVIFHPHQLDQETIDEEMEKVKAYFETGDGKICRLSSLYFIVQGSRAGSTKTEHLLLGKPNILEDLLGMKFQISEASFFQVNTLAAEVLYSQVADWCNTSSNTVLLDVCCGTGTIGLTMAKRVKKVIGLELCKEAVEDAKVNAELNGIENAEFLCGKAEDLFPSMTYRLRGNDVVAVVDPPRGGLHPSLVRALRKSAFVKRLVYVSCNPNGAQNNLVNFTQRESNRFKGPAFKLTEVVPVDLFPQTEHCELVLCLTRD